MLIASGDSVLLPVGQQKVTLVSYYLDDLFLYPVIEANKTTLIKQEFSTFRIDHHSSWRYLKSEMNLIIQTDTESTIYIDDEEIGRSASVLLLDPGVYQLRIEHPTEGSLKQKLAVNYAEGTSVSRYNVNPIKFNPALKILPGAGYLLNGQNQRAIGTYLGLAGLGYALLSTTQKYNEGKNEYDFYGDYITISEKHLNTLKRNRDLSRYGLLGFYLLTTLDGFRKPKNGYPGKTVEFDFTANTFSTTTYPEITFTYRFGD